MKFSLRKKILHRSKSPRCLIWKLPALPCPPSHGLGNFALTTVSSAIACIYVLRKEIQKANFSVKEGGLHQKFEKLFLPTMFSTWGKRAPIPQNESTKNSYFWYKYTIFDTKTRLLAFQSIFSPLWSILSPI